VTAIQKKRLKSAIRKVFWAFDSYPRPEDPDFCGLCYDANEKRFLKVTPLEKFSDDMGRRLTWESADHWASTAVYKHYLPVILQWVAPPRHLDDMTNTHWMDTLKWHGFPTWPAAERGAVGEYVRVVLDLVPESERSDVQEVRAALSELLLLAGKESE